MERKFFSSSEKGYGLHRNIPTERENCRKRMHLSHSTVPLLPPIVQNDLPVSTNVPKTVISENVSPRDGLNSLKKQEILQPPNALPRLERTPFSATTHFTRLKYEPATTNHTKTRRPELRTPPQLDFMRAESTKKQEISVISDRVLRGRRKRKDRLSSYKCMTNSDVIDDEISGFERRVGFDFLQETTAGVPRTCVKDMKGRLIRSNDIYGEGASSLISIIDNDEDEKFKKSLKKDSENDTPKIQEKSNPVRKRFLKALDTHFYNEFLAGQSGRRMAICEELEKLISGDGKTSLNGLREHLRLQDVLDSWVL